MTKPDQTSAASWNFDEGYGNTVTDNSFTTYAATVTGPTWKNEDFCLQGKCLFFDGSDDYVASSSTTIFDAGLTYTIMFWIKPTFGGESSTETVLAKAGVVQVNLDDTNDNIVVLYPGNGTSASSQNNTISVNKWNHVAVTHNGSGTITIYINGIDQTNDSTVTDTNSAAVVVFGSETNGTSSQSFQGFIDTVRILSSTLTANQIISHVPSNAAGESGTATVFGSTPQRILSEGLVGYWNFNEDSGNATDTSGNSITLTDTNTVLRSAGKFDKGGDFELSQSEYFYAADNPTLSITSGISISSWIKPETVSAGLYNIVSKWDGTNESYRLVQNADEIRMEIDNNGNYQETTSANLTTGAFYHVVGVYDASSSIVKIYINGIESTSSTVGTIPTSIGDDNSRFHIGAEDSTTTASNFYDGIIDEVRIYNKALTAAEVQTVYDWAPQPIAYFPFDENNGTSSVNDISGNGMSGTMGGSMTQSDWVPGVFGSALEFDGTDDVITVNDNSTLDITKGLTLSLWVNDPPPEYKPGQEVIEKRTINSKTIFKGNKESGEKTYEYQSALGPIHYKEDLKDNEEAWKEIDTTVVETQGEYQFRNEKNFFKSFFKKWSTDQHTVKYQVGNASITYSLKDNELGRLQHVAAVPEKNVVIYPQVFPNVDARFSVQSVRLLEEFVFHTYQPVERISQEIHFENAYFVQQEDGSYAFFDQQTKEPVWTIPVPIMYEDTNFPEKNFDIHYELTCKRLLPFLPCIKNTFILTKVIDEKGQAWLKDTLRQFPVVIDASMDLTIATGSDDAYLNDVTYNDSSISIQFGGVGSSPVTNHGQGFRFQNVTIPRGSTVDTAKLQLAMAQNNWNTIYARITAINEDNTATFSSGSPPGSRPIVSSYIADDVQAVNRTLGTYYDWPDDSTNQQTLGNAIETVFARSGWASGNALGIVNNSDQDASAYTNFGRELYAAFDAGYSSYYPKLNIVYTEPPILIGKGRDAYQLEITNSLTVIGYLNTSNTVSSTVTKTWRHVAMTYDGAKLKLYIDGKLESSTNVTGDIVTNTTNLRIGNTVPGKIDDVKIYNYARSADQVIEDMNGSHPLGGSPIGSQVIYWQLDEMQGTTANNRLANGTDGTLSNFASPATSSSGWTKSGKNNAALTFDGTDDAITIATASDESVDFNGNESFSGSAWVYVTTMPGSGEQDLIIGKWDATNNQRAYKLTVENDDVDTTGNFQVNLYDESADQEIIATGTNDSVAVNTWYHVAFTFNGGTAGAAGDLKLYIDGSLTDSNVNNASFLGLENVTSDFTVGNYDTNDANASNTPFTGKIDEVKLYSATLTASEILIDRNANAAISVSVGQNETALLSDGTGNQPIAAWNFDENTGTDLYDQSGNGATGTLTNGPVWDVGKIGQSLRFDGTNDNVQLNSYISNVEGRDAGTISVWFKSNRNGTGTDAIFSIENTSASTDVMWLTVGDTTSLVSDDSIFFFVKRGNTALLGMTVRKGHGYYQDNQWHHAVIITGDGNNRMIIDGIPQTMYFAYGSATTNEFSNITGANRMWIGLVAITGTTYYHSGNIDQLEIYDYAMTNSQAIYKFNRGGPVGHWKMDESSWTNDCSTDAVFDSSGNTNHGDACPASTGPTGAAAGKFNNAGDFDGSNDYITIPDSTSLDITGSFTLSAWINMDTAVSAGRLRNLISKSGDLDLDTAGTGSNYLLTLKNGLFGTGSGIVCGFEDSTHTDFNAYVDIPIATGIWQMITCVFDETANTLTFYVNDKQVSQTGSVTGIPATQNQSLLIGGEPAATAFSLGENFNGKIDSAKIYNYALSVNQIERLHNEDAAIRFGR